MASFHMRRRVMKSEARKIIFSNPLYFFGTSFLLIMLVAGGSSFLKIYSRTVSSVTSDGVKLCFEILLYLLVFLVLSNFFAELLRSYILFKKNTANKGIYSFKGFTKPREFCEQLRLSAFAAILSFFKFIVLNYLPMIVGKVIASSRFGSEILDSLFGFSLYILCFFIIALLSVWLNGFFMVFFFRDNSDESGFYSKLSRSKDMMKGKRGELFLLNLSFVPHFLTVYFTFGISLIYVLPYYLNTLCSFAFYVAEDSKKSTFYAFT